MWDARFRIQNAMCGQGLLPSWPPLVSRERYTPTSRMPETGPDLEGCFVVYVEILRLGPAIFLFLTTAQALVAPPERLSGG